MFNPFSRVQCVDYVTLWTLNVLFSLFVSVEPSHCEFEDDFFSVFHTQISPENYENCMQNMKTGMFNLCDYITRGCWLYTEIAMDERDLVQFRVNG